MLQCPFFDIYKTSRYNSTNLKHLQQLPEYVLPKEFRNEPRPVQCNGCGATHNEDKCPYCGRQCV